MTTADSRRSSRDQVGTQAREHDVERGKSLAGALCQGHRSRRNVEHPRSQGGLRKGHRARTSKSTIYNLLARHGWRKLMPRPFHPRRDIAAQNAFKKMAFQMP